MAVSLLSVTQTCVVTISNAVSSNFQIFDILMRVQSGAGGSLKKASEFYQAVLRKHRKQRNTFHPAL